MHPLLSGSLRVEAIPVAIAGLPPVLSGCRIVQLSDFHYDGRRLSEAMLSAAIAQTNAAQPDLVVLTGDYVTDDPSPIYPLSERLRRLRSRCGVIAVLGNHDLRWYIQLKRHDHAGSECSRDHRTVEPDRVSPGQVAAHCRSPGFSIAGV